MKRHTSRTNRAAEVAIVSGGSRGLGLAVVRRLLETGWSVATFSRGDPPADLGPRRRLHWCRVDARDADAVKRFVAEVHERWGAVHALVNNGAIMNESLLTMAREREIVDLVATNVTAPLLLTRAALKVMLLSRGGRIVNVSSIVGRVGVRGVAAYSATKAALEGLTRSLAREVGELGIRVNAVAPGYLDTDMTGGMTEEQRARIVRRTPLGRLGQVGEVAGVIEWLLSPGAAFITGQTFVVDGGFTC